jgi:hypothetical protein
MIGVIHDNEISTTAFVNCLEIGRFMLPRNARQMPERPFLTTRKFLPRMRRTQHPLSAILIEHSAFF